jgi:hypothetical protein
VGACWPRFNRSRVRFSTLGDTDDANSQLTSLFSARMTGMINSLPNILIANNNIDLPVNPTYPPPTRMVGPVQLFPADYYFNSPVNKLPLDPQSSQKIAALGVGRLGSEPEFALNVVSGPQVGAAIIWGGSLESDGGNYPITPQTLLSSYVFGTPQTVGNNTNFGGDNHLCMINTDTGLLYETFGLNTNVPPYPISNGAIWDLNSYQLRTACKLIPPIVDTDGLTSADAAGMPMWPLVLTHAEAFGGSPILHAFRLTLPQALVSQGYIWPATHAAGGTGGSGIVLGTCFRLQASFDVSPFPSWFQRILTALKTYGLYFTDNGTGGLISADCDQAWGDPNATTSDTWIINGLFHQIPFSALEIVDNQARVISTTSGQVRPWWPVR